MVLEFVIELGDGGLNIGNLWVICGMNRFAFSLICTVKTCFLFHKYWQGHGTMLWEQNEGVGPSVTARKRKQKHNIQGTCVWFGGAWN